MKHLNLFFGLVMLFIFALSCNDESELTKNEMSQHLHDSLKMLLTQKWVLDDISGSDSGIKDIDSNKCIDGIPYEFINGNKFEKNANHP